MLYRFGDLTLASDLPLSQLPEAPHGGADCSLTVRPDAGPSPAGARWDHHWRSPGGRVELSCARDGGAYRLGVPGLATFAIENEGRTITCLPQGNPPSNTLEHLVIDQVLPRVLTHRGRLVLHAGCVATPRGAIAFLGDSGAGKSTLCGAFARSGDPVLGDDGIVVRPNDTGGFEAIATYPGLRLLPDPLEFLFGAPTRWAPVAHHTSKRRVDGAHAGFELSAKPSPLRGIYLLGDGPRIEILPLTGGNAFVALVRASFQMHLDDARRSQELFERIGALVDSVPLRRVSYPRDLSLLPAVREAVRDDALGRGAVNPANSAGCACS